MLKKNISALLFTAVTFISCSDSAVSGTDGETSSEQLVVSSSLQSSAKSSSSAALSSGTSTTSASSPSSSLKTSSASAIYWNQSISYGVLSDTRDKKKYRTTQIGSQNWMAENLNFTATVGVSRCYEGKTTNCTKYGRLYDWEAASASCPEGWHLPDSTEWNQLAKYLGNASVAGKILKASSTLWSTNTGNDAFGFAALPSGSYDNEQYYDLGTAALWWTSSDLNSTTAYYRDIIGTANALRTGQESKVINLAVRCLEDSEPSGSSSEEISSSSEVVSSSSQSVSSSIAPLVPPDRNCTYAPVTPATSPATGTLTCPNNEVYKTVNIGSAVWMAQNLNYGTRVNGTGSTSDQSNDGVIEKYCYEDKVENCVTDGGLYQWAEAMAFKFACNSVLLSDATCNASISAKNHQGICPTGWRMPKASEWDALVTALGGNAAIVGSKMKLNNTSFPDWNSLDTVAYNDGNSSGFSAVPAGGRHPYYGFNGRGYWTYFWGVPETGVESITSFLNYKESFLGIYFENGKAFSYSVRCVKNP